MARYIMAIDLERCLGCQACLVACKAENGVPAGYHRLRMRETVVGKFPTLQGEFRLEHCFHCQNAPCISVCPTGATFKNEAGLVLVDPAKCTGCAACVAACPYDMRYIHPDGYVDKCTYCNHRLEQGRAPACVETCPTGARIFGDLEDPDNPVSEAVENAERAAVLKPETDTQPNLIYLNSRFINSAADNVLARVVSDFAETDDSGR